MGDAEPRNILQKLMNVVGNAFIVPTKYVRENLVEPNQKQYPWYHQKFRRVPSIDECYTDDVVCVFEANEQYKRDRRVDTQILKILRSRYEDCVLYERPDHKEKCAPIYEQYKVAETDWFTKYGDLGGYHDAKGCYMKQKHRMIWERRHGPVGSGMKQDSTATEN